MTKRSQKIIRLILAHLTLALILYYFGLVFIDIVSRGIVSRLFPVGLLPVLMLAGAWGLSLVTSRPQKKPALPLFAFIILLVFSGFLIFIALSPHDLLTAGFLAVAVPGLVFFLRTHK